MSTAHCPRGPALHLQQVALQLGGTRILDAINWHVQPGQVHALIGPNGCGKSSLLKTILGLMPHTGEVQLHWGTKTPGRLAYVPQAIESDRSLPMTVRDFLATMCQRRPLFLGIEKQALAQIHTALAQVGMQDKAKRRMGDLSGGERQRVLLAQSLLPAPDLLLLDEPMAALDAEGVKIFEQLLQHWRTQGCTIVWVEHNLDAVCRLADRVTGLNGHILFTDTPAILHYANQILRLFSHRCNAHADAPTDTAPTPPTPPAPPAPPAACG